MKEAPDNLPSVDTNGMIDLMLLIEHSESVPAGDSLDAVYNLFRSHTHTFVAVVEDRRYVGIVSRGQLGFLLGSRYGFSLHASQPVRNHIMQDALFVRSGQPIMNVLEQTLSRANDDFYNDVALVDSHENYLGIISFRTLVRLQARIISTQACVAQTQKLELEQKHQQLFRSLNELRQSQGRYEALLQNSALAVALLNNTGEVEVCNRKAEIIFESFSARRNVPRNLVDLISPTERKTFLELLQYHEAGINSFPTNEQEFTINTGEHESRLFRFFTSWVKETGQVCVLFHDITEQRALERRVALDEKSAMFESLVGGVAHELNNKLAPVIGYAEILETRLNAEVPLDDLDLYECVRIIHVSATESSKIVKQLLQLARPPSSEKSPVDFGAVVAEAGTILQYRLRAGGVKLMLDIIDDPVCVIGDAMQLKQVVINLMMNAIDAMDHAVVKELRLTVRVEKTFVHLLVYDTGQGIPSENLNRIFDPFFTTKSPNRGTGLGLSVCLSIIRQHQGEIVVNSTCGIGSIFEVILPLVPAAAMPPRSQPKPLLPSAARHLPESVSRMTAMVVDDEEYVTAMVQEILRRKLGWRVERIHNAKHAIERLDQALFDIVISDVRMPEIDGIALYHWIKDSKPALASRMLFITGDAGGSDLTHELQSFGRPVIHKPFSADLLIEHCRRLVNT